MLCASSPRKLALLAGVAFIPGTAIIKGLEILERTRRYDGGDASLVVPEAAEALNGFIWWGTMLMVLPIAWALWKRDARVVLIASMVVEAIGGLVALVQLPYCLESGMVSGRVSGLQFAFRAR